MKSLPLSKALDDNTLLAYEMNGASLPHWNGFPVRLVVAGLGGDLLGEAAYDCQRVEPPARQLLDEHRLPCPEGQVFRR